MRENGEWSFQLERDRRATERAMPQRRIGALDKHAILGPDDERIRLAHRLVGSLIDIGGGAEHVIGGCGDVEGQRGGCVARRCARGGCR